MIKEIFVQQFYPLAQAAGKLFNINPVVVLAQAAIESGWAESRLSKDYNSFFGITGYGGPTDYWAGEKIRLNETGLLFRRYASARDSFFDFCRLIRSSYTVAANVSNVPAAYAQEIAYSRYISEVNGDNRQNYKRILIRISADMERLIALQFPEHKD